MTQPTAASESLILQKLGQVPAILKEQAIDAWLLFVRESEVLHDPTLDTLVGANVTWQSAFLFDATGRRTAIVGSLDVARIERTGNFAEVIGYGEGVGADLRRILGDWDPQSLALNFSTETELADGLTHGMYLLLERYLEGTPYLARAVSSQPLVAAMRGRKSASEVERIQKACTITQEIFDAVTPQLRVG
ncbi:MAG: aminopeptidase P family protein, partial [Deltaproteobacteria bacterium]|nr:aminopeptidase P family protein [Deltaproteobacteria bacterium]